MVVVKHSVKKILLNNKKTKSNLYQIDTTTISTLK